LCRKTAQGKSIAEGKKLADAMAAPLFEAVTPIKIKEESMEIKNEPLDYFSETGMEEPIVDMYCPSTGTSRLLYQSTMSTYGGTRTHHAISDQSESTNQSFEKALTQSNKFVRNLSCDLCGEHVYSYFLSPLDQSKARE
ncbi:hypothetical protein PMAYCL1PPCAC_08388, partial [Pristionchus mayeri]